MITYVDTSTLLKLIVNEPGSETAEQIWTAANSLVSISLIEVEARAALAAAQRHGRLSPTEYTSSVKSLRQLLDQIDIIDVTASLITRACDLTRVHRLRAYDAAHLAGATTVQADVFTSADTVLCDAATAEGIQVANPLI